jgi:hypothetical protein
VAENRERQFNLQVENADRAGVYANFATVTFTDYEFAITFARVDHEVEQDEIPGVVVARVNMSKEFTRELMTALNDSWSKYSTVKGIKELPETTDEQDHER